MKKIILTAVAATICVALVGCGGNKTDPAIANLNNQLDETANAISSIQTISPTEFNINKAALHTTASSATNLSSNMMETQQAVSADQYYKTEILNKTARLKQNLGTNLKLSKSQISAIKDLTGALNKYTTSVNYSKNEIKNAAKSISNLKKDISKNSDKINAKLNRIICNCNARAAYFENILKTLDEIENYVTCEDCQTETPNTESQNSNKISNIDTYQNQDTENQQDLQTNFTKPERKTYNSNEINRLALNRSYGFNGYYNGGMPYGGYGYNGFYGNYAGTNGINGNYGTFGNGYGYGNNNFGMYGNGGMYGNNMYGYGAAYGYPNMPYMYRFNYNRNTDTYAPMLKNIDTYKINPNGNNLAQEVPAMAEQNRPYEKLPETQKDESIELLNKQENSTNLSPMQNKMDEVEKENLQNINTIKSDSVKPQPSTQPVLTVAKLFKHKHSELDAPTVAH